MHSQPEKYFPRSIRLSDAGITVRHPIERMHQILTTFFIFIIANIPIPSAYPESLPILTRCDESKKTNHISQQHRYRPDNLSCSI